VEESAEDTATLCDFAESLRKGCSFDALGRLDDDDNDKEKHSLGD
jgi:hypothetical protein